MIMIIFRYANQILCKKVPIRVKQLRNKIIYWDYSTQLSYFQAVSQNAETDKRQKFPLRLLCTWFGGNCSNIHIKEIASNFSAMRAIGTIRQLLSA